MLSFAANGYFGANPDAALAVGTDLPDAHPLHYYPVPPPVRAVIGDQARPCGPGPAARGAGRPWPRCSATWAPALEQDPWLTEWPALLAGHRRRTGRLST